MAKQTFASYCAEKRAILEAATPGHWLTFDEGGMYSGEIHVVDDDDGGPRTAMHHITSEPEGDDHADDRAALVDSMNHRQAELEALAELWDHVAKEAAIPIATGEMMEIDAARAALQRAAAKLGVTV
jgi:hypothetical protein